MAIRVKKLARQLRATPEVVLVALSDLGYSKYKNPMDMVADTAANKVRALARKQGLPKVRPRTEPAPARPATSRSAVAPPGRAQTPTPARTATSKPSSTRAPSSPRSVMSSLVPGTVPAHDDPLDVPLDQLARGAADPAAPAPAGGSTVDRARAIAEEEKSLQRRSQALAERARALEAEQERLVEDRRRLMAEVASARAEVDALKDELDARASGLDALEAGGLPLSDLLTDRGLRGRDEWGRALEALARARLLDPLLDRIRVIEPAAVHRVLRDRLVLAAGAHEDLAGVALVTVPSDRAEIPDAAGLGQLRSDLAGEFLLAGLTRVRIVGGGPILVRLLRGGLDPRVELDLVPAVRREAGDARRDVADVDALVLWGVSESEEAAQVYAESSAEILRVSLDGGLRGLLAGVRLGLQPD